MKNNTLSRYDEAFSHYFSFVVKTNNSKYNEGFNLVDLVILSRHDYGHIRLCFREVLQCRQIRINMMKIKENGSAVLNSNPLVIHKPFLSHKTRNNWGGGGGGGLPV